VEICHCKTCTDGLHVIIVIIAIANSLFTCFLSHNVSIFTHMNSIHFSALSMHYPQCKTLQHASVVCYITDITLSRMTPGASVVCCITDITLSRMTPGASVVCYITDITLSRMTPGASVVCCITDMTSLRMTGAGSHLVPRILHWLLTEKVEKFENGQILWVHTLRLFQTKGEMCAKFGSDQFRNVNLYKFHTNKQTFIFIYRVSEKDCTFSKIFLWAPVVWWAPS
jgi:hypothetical protein